MSSSGGRAEVPLYSSTRGVVESPYAMQLHKCDAKTLVSKTDAPR